MKTRTLLTAAMLTLLLFPLQAQEPPVVTAPAPQPAVDDVTTPVVEPTEPAAEPETEAALPPVEEDGDDDHSPNSKRHVIRNATVILRSFAPQETSDAVVGELEALGAYVQSSETGTLNLHVPEPQLEAAMEMLKELGDVVDEQMSSEDVSLEIVQLKARIGEIDNGRNRLIGMLKKAEDVQAMLDVQRELDSVTQNLENQQGRLRYLFKRVGESTLVVQVSMKARPQVERMPAHRRPHGWVQSYGIESLFQ